MQGANQPRLLFHPGWWRENKLEKIQIPLLTLPLETLLHIPASFLAADIYPPN